MKLYNRNALRFVEIVPTTHNYGDGAARWEDLDLSGEVPAGAKVLTMAGASAAGVNNVGIREDGSALARLLTVGVGVWHPFNVNAGASRIVEIYNQGVGTTNVYACSGYWI